MDPNDERIVVVIIDRNYGIGVRQSYDNYDICRVLTEQAANELIASEEGDIIVVYSDGFKVPWFMDVIKKVLKITRVDNDNLLSLEQGCHEVHSKVDFLLDKKYHTNQLQKKSLIIFVMYNTKPLFQKLPEPPILKRLGWDNVKSYSKKGLLWCEYTKSPKKVSVQSAKV